MAFTKKQVDPTAKVEAPLAEAIRGSLREGTLTCAAAFEIAAELKVPRINVGRGADTLHIPLSRCQLGLFGYPDAAKIWESPDYTEPAVKPEVVEAIKQARTPEGTISCAELMAVADRFAILRAVAGRAADREGIRIKVCQLGAF